MSNSDGKKNISEWCNEVLAKTDLVRLISSYTPLHKKGNTHWACCPFHIEKTPSFSVSEQKQLYYCFGCKASGNAISFVKQIESVESFEAIKILSEAAGIAVPSFSRTDSDSDDAAFIEKRTKLYALMREAAKHYHENLVSKKAPAALSYLHKRGIDNALIVKFGLGYSLGGSEIIEHLKACGYTEQEMKEAGIAELSERGWYDVFYDRLMIPIISNFKEVVAFGARTLKPNPDFAKYRNSSQTVIFNKSRVIYGINLLKAKKQREGAKSIDYVIMCEGYMDVIALHKAGFDTAVASMGTALTSAQAKQLKFFCEKIYISYDGDFAGKEATIRGLEILSEAGLSVKVVSLPEGMDPDDVINKKGKAEYERLLREAKTLTAFKIEVLKQKYSMDAADEKSKFAVEAIRVIKALENPVEAEEYLSIVQKATGYSMPVLLAQADIVQLPVKPAPPETAAAQATQQDNSKIEKAKVFILAALAGDCPYIDYTENFSDLLSDTFYSSLAEFITACKRESRPLSSVYTEFGEEHKERLDEIMYYNFLEGNNAAHYKSCVTMLKIDALEKQKNEIVDTYTQTKDISCLNKLKAVELKIKELKRL